LIHERKENRGKLNERRVQRELTAELPLSNQVVVDFTLSCMNYKSLCSSTHQSFIIFHSCKGFGASLDEEEGREKENNLLV
jgi:hypothetical protein